METERKPAEAWDAYWKNKITHFAKHGIPLDWDNLIGFPAHERMLRKRGVRRILLIGNGCSPLPHSLVPFGYAVTVLDISAVANEYVVSYPQRKRHRKQKKQDVRDKPRVPGGSLTVITGDVLTWEPKNAEPPFDAIYDDRLMMLLGDWPEIARRYSRWLQPQGVCVVHTINLGGGMGVDCPDVFTEFASAFTDAGFIKMIPEDFHSIASPGKIVAFIHGSG